MGSDEENKLLSSDKKFRRIFHKIRQRPLTVLLACGLVTFVGAFLGLWSFRHFQCYTREAGIQWKPASILDIRRPCPSIDSMYKTVAVSKGEKPRICMTTLTDSKSPSLWQRLLRCRDFDGVAKLTFPNLQSYADKHGYSLWDASASIDTSRPPAWSKILAVQKLLTQTDSAPCDWVFWVDADIVVMNSTIAIESFLPSAESTEIDLLITMDRRLTANSGAWLIRNTKWSREFLQAWWNMRRWVREPGLSLSGDNAAFGHLTEERLKSDADRIRMVPRCTFNSFAVFLPDDKESSLTLDQTQDWYLSKNFYHKGDFMAHASGVDQKEACVSMLLAKSI
mmetsp:Transcript_25518/g.48336  ORF Transcript_25518/g.48336 Transcript_25518/m.48336 type:complete len:338 (-) Transcript_25518:28-1041(-)